MANRKIHIEDQGLVVTAILDLNEKNTINALFVEQMTELMNRYEKSDEIRALVITNKGPFFSNGFDPAPLVGASEDEVKKNVGEAFNLLGRYYEMPFITICAMNGHSMGYGAILALFSDFRFMANAKVRIGYPEALIGLALPQSTTLLLKQLVGYKQARDLAIFGKGIKPENALEIGLIDDVFEADELLKKAEKFAAKFVSLSRQSLVGNKLSLQTGLTPEQVKEAIKKDYEVSARMIMSRDGQEGLSSILEGRRPKFN